MLSQQVITHVYVAGPMNSSGRLMANVREACRIASILRREGFSVYLPHLNVLWELAEGSEPDHFWLDNDFAWIGRSDALLRLEGESKGGDLEVAYAKGKGIPVYDARELGSTARAIRALLRDRAAVRVEGQKEAETSQKTSPEASEELLKPDPILLHRIWDAGYQRGFKVGCGDADGSDNAKDQAEDVRLLAPEGIPVVFPPAVLKHLGYVEGTSLYLIPSEGGYLLLGTEGFAEHLGRSKNAD